MRKDTYLVSETMCFLVIWESGQWAKPINQVILVLFYLTFSLLVHDRLCGIVVRVHGYIYRDPSWIPGAITFSEK
jgi:hypothetical protein